MRQNLEKLTQLRLPARFLESCSQSPIEGEPPELPFSKVEPPQVLSLASSTLVTGVVGAAVAMVARVARRIEAEKRMLEEVVVVVEGGCSK